MAQNEVEFLFKARDEVSAQLAEINRQIEATGAASEKAGRQTSSLTKFVREQKQEQRTQNFLFREGAQTLGALSLGLSLFSSFTGNASQSTKDLSNSLNSGFLAFQGISFALAGLNPTIGITVAAIAGIGAVLGTMNTQADEGAKRALALKVSIAKLNQELTKSGSEAVLGALNNALKEAEDRFKKLERVTIDWFASLFRPRLFPAFKINEESLKAEEEVKKTQKEIADVRQKDIDKRIAGVTNLLAKSKQETAELAAQFPIQAAITKTVSERLKVYTTLGKEEGMRLADRERELNAQKEMYRLSNEALRKVSVSNLPDPDIWNRKYQTVLDQIGMNFENLGTISEQVGNTISSTMGGAADIMANVFIGKIKDVGEAFKSLIQLMIAELIKMGLLKLFAGIATGGATTVGGAGPLLAKTAPAHVPIGPSGKTITINVKGESVSGNVDERKRVMRQIERAIFTEKYA